MVSIPFLFGLTEQARPLSFSAKADNSDERRAADRHLDNLDNH